jgi:hypothetical protein
MPIHYHQVICNRPHMSQPGEQGRRRIYHGANENEQHPSHFKRKSPTKRTHGSARVADVYPYMV